MDYSTKKEKIIEILKTYENKEFCDFFMKDSDKMSPEDINDIYVCLTVDDENAINEIVKKRNERFSELISRLDLLDTKVRRKILNHKEQKENKKDMKDIENLFDNI
ncbi:hypothetical protein [Candidatus Vampirococcus lugosii]|uniref:Uncharacterized protein n=1 Tax=Candidatus Vampirococcus lugosii TaxID=2789015 RepID=A0ABS5QM65_9BACT|nr:hypothetical protein [Candidatus Vampirococcus lugosii]MBS8121853.1 hypothetical protein [Candidatus Vampirococcus lugosii]